LRSAVASLRTYRYRVRDSRPLGASGPCRLTRLGVVATIGGSHSTTWACGAAGSAPEWHSGGHRFDPGQVHHPSLACGELRLGKPSESASGEGCRAEAAVAAKALAISTIGDATRSGRNCDNVERAQCFQPIVACFRRPFDCSSHPHGWSQAVRLRPEERRVHAALLRRSYIRCA
jgi:hypothetical protein